MQRGHTFFYLVILKVLWSKHLPRDDENDTEQKEKGDKLEPSEYKAKHDVIYLLSFMEKFLPTCTMNM
jgi:hypothetical protein